MNKKLSKKEKIELNKIALANALDFRKKFNLGTIPIEDVFSLDFSKDFFLIKFPNDIGVSGAFLRKKGRNCEYKCIYINTLEPLGRQHLSFLHEVYHMLYEESDNTLCDYNENYNPVEFKATSFANFVLIPRDYLKEKLEEIKNKSNEYYIHLEQLLDLQKLFSSSLTALVLAISTLDEEYLIPKNINNFFKYKYKSKWKELEEKTKKYDSLNLLNSTNITFECSKEFKENIDKNLKEGLVTNDEVADIYDFFDF